MLKSKLRDIEKRVTANMKTLTSCGQPVTFFPNYEVTADEFDHVVRNVMAFFEMTPTLPRTLSKEQGDVIRNSALQDWYEWGIREVMKRPHRIKFELRQFGLDYVVNQII
ncbi:MAG: hypothetical protein JW763_05665 [candidate division Zixibacteria bacterium]|nr:hypothetical protein [candidate division Zixibacteria bacterium]